MFQENSTNFDWEKNDDQDDPEKVLDNQLNRVWMNIGQTIDLIKEIKDI